MEASAPEEKKGGSGLLGAGLAALGGGGDGPGGGGGKNKGDAPFSKRVQRVFPFALELAGREELRGPSGSGDIVRSEHLLLALIEDDDSGAVAALQRLDVDVDELRAEIRADAERGTGEAELVAGRGNKDNTTPTLSECGIDLTEAARAGKLDPVMGRESEVARALQVLVRRRKSNPCLMGEPGVGKTAIAEGIAQRIVDGNVPKRLRDKRVVSLELAQLVAGTRLL